MRFTAHGRITCHIIDDFRMLCYRRNCRASACERTVVGFAYFLFLRRDCSEEEVAKGEAKKQEINFAEQIKFDRLATAVPRLLRNVISRAASPNLPLYIYIDLGSLYIYIYIYICI